MRENKKMLNQRGYITITALWVSMIFVMLSAGLVVYLQYQQRAVKNHTNKVKAYYIAKAGLVNMIYSVVTAKGGIKDEAVFRELNNANQGVAFSDGIFSAYLEDEKAKANLNTASAGLLKSIFRDLKINESDKKADAIINWRKQNRLFTSVEELGLIQELDVNDCSIINPYFTVYSKGSSGSGSLNVNTASKTVIKAYMDEFKAASTLTDVLILNLPFNNDSVLINFIKKRSPKMSNNMIRYFTSSTSVYKTLVVASIGQNIKCKLNTVFETWNQGHEPYYILYTWYE